MITLPQRTSESKPRRLSPRQRQIVDQAWRLCRPALDRIGRKAPHHADAIAAILSERLRLTAPGYHPDRLTVREFARIQLHHALVQGVRQVQLAESGHLLSA